MTTLLRILVSVLDSIESRSYSLTVSSVGNASALAKVDTGEHLMKLLYS